MIGLECCRAELLTNVCLYWFSGCITSSTRLYYETLGPLGTGEGRSLFVRKAEVPCGAPTPPHTQISLLCGNMTSS